MNSILYFILSAVMLFCVLLLGASLTTNKAYIAQGAYNKLYPLVDGCLLAYVVAYFAFIYGS